MQDETEFLRDYDASAFERPSVAVDLVLMSVVGGAIVALLMQRREPPHQGRWALPGGFVGVTETLEDAAVRVMREKARLTDAFVEQLYTFGAPDRDPRTRVISVAYVALLPAARFTAAALAKSDLCLARIELDGTAPGDGAVAATSADSKLPLAFDHAAILGTAVRRLRGKLDYTPIALTLLPSRFTLRELQEIHEAILGVALNKPAFRRRMLDKGWIAPTGEHEANTSYRPAELYRRQEPHAPSIVSGG